MNLLAQFKARFCIPLIICRNIILRYKSFFSICFRRTILLLALTYMPTRIIINHRVIRTVSIQVQPIPTIGIFLQKPPHHRIIVSRP